MTDQTAERAPGVRIPLSRLGPEQHPEQHREQHPEQHRPDPDQALPVDPPSVFADGVEVARLVARVQLTAAQAVELALAVLAEAVRRAGPSGEAPASGPFAVGADGRVVRRRPGERPPADGPEVGAVLAELAEAARPRAETAGPTAEQLLGELDRTVVELPVTGCATAARSLHRASAAIDRRAVRAELGALVRVVGAQPLPVGAPGAPRAARAEPARAVRPRRPRPLDGRRRSARRRVGAWLLALVLVAGCVLLEVGLLRDHISADVRQLLDAGRSGSTAAAAQSAGTQPSADRPVPAPAPSAAGPVAGVDLRALAPCAPGRPCTVRLLVRLAPAAGPRTVSWTYRITDRCTGAGAPAPGGSTDVPAGATQAVVVADVPLPAEDSVALVAVTDRPASAASPAVTAGTCPRSP